MDAIRTTTRRIDEISIHADANPPRSWPSSVESDNHADTWCLGPNFTVTEWTGQVCNVSGFNDKITETGIRVATGFTIYEDSITGVSHLLQVNQGLDMRHVLNHTLANPNQTRDHGVSWCDDAYDEFRKLGINHDGTYIPFQLVGSTVQFASRPPSLDEIHELYDKRLVLTSDAEWNPKDLRPPKRKASEMRIVRSTNLTEIASMRRDVDNMSLRVCSHMERDAGYIQDGNDNRYLSGISTALTDETLLPRMISNVNIAKIASKTRHSDISPESLSRKWRIGLETSRATLAQTTQQGIRTAIRPISRRYRTDLQSKKINRIRASVFTDTCFVNVKSMKQNTCYQGYSCDNLIRIYPMRSQTDAAQSLIDFAHEVGAPDTITSDEAPLLQGPQCLFRKNANFLHSALYSAEAGTQKQNRYEGENGILKARWKSQMREYNIPKRLWDYSLQYEAQILSMIARGSDGIPGLERVTGNRVDITEWLDFTMWDRVWIMDEPDGSSPPKLARWLGVSHRVGSALCYFVIKANGQIESRTTVQHVTEDDLNTPGIKEQIDAFDKSLNEKVNDENFLLPQGEDVYDDLFDDDRDDNNTINDQLTDLPALAERDDVDDGAFDSLVGAEVMLPNEHADGHISGTVLKRATDRIGNNLGRKHELPALDSRMYVVKLTDGTERELQHNLIAQNIFAQCDSEGRQYLLLDEICDVRSDDTAIKLDDPCATTRSHNGNIHRKKTTKGWEFLCSWKDQTQTWVPLKDIMASNPLEVAEFAVSRGLEEVPAFAWWVEHTLSTRKRIIDKVKTRYWKQEFKFGIRLPKSVEEALRFDQENGNDLWTKGIEKEMKTVKVAYHPYRDSNNYEPTATELRNNRQKWLVGYKEVTCHLIYDIKLDGYFTRKARYVANGSKTEWPKSMTYSSVVSRESVRIAFLAAGLNGLKISACDISGAYLNAPVGEKVYFIAKIECGIANKGRVMIIVRALYGLKSSAKAWRTFFSKTLDSMGYKSCLADPDVYMKPMTDHKGNKYWSYMLVYVDDCLLVHHEPDPVMEELKTHYSLKNDTHGPPERYLGANVEMFQLGDGTSYWSMHPRDYVVQSVKLVQGWCVEDKRPWKKKRKNAMQHNYLPELDTSRELGDDLGTRYQQMIGILRWAVELGRIDIITEISHMSSFNASPREGHLEALYQIFEYLGNHETGGRVVYDSLYPPGLDESRFEDANWSEVYGDVEEAIPLNVPEARGNNINITMYCDASHAGCKLTRRSQTGIIILLQGAPIVWYSKKQQTVEASTFGAEFVALRVACEMNDALRYKLRMMGFPLNNETSVYCDNQAVVHNTTKVESTLKKKHLSVCYHFVRESCAKGAIRIAYESTTTNLADICTKIMSWFQKKTKLRCILY